VHANPTSLFPVLPPDADAIKNGWSSAMPIDETKCSYTAPDGPPSPDAETWTFEEDIDNVFTPIYEITRHCTNEFDVKRGIVRKLTSTSKQGWPKSQEERVHQGVMEFAEQRTIESPELTSLDKEMMRYFDVCAAYDDVMEKADFTNMKETLGEAEGVLKQAQGTFNVPAVEAMIEKKLDDFNQSRAYELENAERFGKLIGKPSEDWKTEDLAGHPRSLEDYKGKVVLLDFWYRGCGWCIRAMPQLKQLSDEFPKDKVAVIGMNNDRHQEDAQLVIEKMGLNYETLKNGSFDDGIHSKYGVQGWPTLVVLDGQGVVRDVHVGYSPNLRKELGDKIRKLLGEKVAEN